MLAAILLMFIGEVVNEEVSTPASLLGPRDFNYHPYEARQFLEETSLIPTKQGPVVFPNPLLPPTKRPLVVTARPLTESIANSDFLQNNTVAESSLVNSVTYQPFLARVNQYKPYNSVPYADMLKRAEERGFLRANGYTNYEQATVLPPIYKALSDYARQKVLNQKQNQNQPRSRDYYEQYNDLSGENQNSDYDQNKNYAFSYTVKDHKTGDDFSHSQQSTGSATNGEYRVRLPDGRIQIVSYTADENGYKADVRYNDDHSDNRIDDLSNKHNNDNTNFNTYKVTNNDVTNYVREEIPIKENNYESNEFYDYNDYDKNKAFSNKFFYPSSTPSYTSVIKDNNIQDSFINKFLNNPSSTVSYATTLKPSYEEIKDSLDKVHNPRVNYINENAVEINEPYTDTQSVIIGANRYTDVSSISKVTPFNIISSTPSYISSYKDSKPILSNNYINRINKYLTFN